MNVEIIASEISDNFFYCLEDSSGRAVLIDPIDADQAVAHLDGRGLDLEMVVNTHFHPDHIGGNDAVFDHSPGAVLAVGQTDADRVEADQSHPVDRRLTAGEAIDIGDLHLEVLDTPGHTLGHISLRCGQALFSGDTIFVGGAGNCTFGGDPSALYRTFDSVLRGIDDQVTFYPGHDYAVRDLEFIASIEPTNERARSLLEDARNSRDRDELFVTSLGVEKSYSPFFRYHDAGLQDRLRAEHAVAFDNESAASQCRPEAVFRTVRQLRNRW